MSRTGQVAYRKSLLARAGLGAQRSSTGRHPIERMASSCTDVAVRTHIPVLIGLEVVLVPIAGADQAMRAIAAAVWPDDPSPLEEAGYRAGARSSEYVLDARDNAIEVLMSTRPDADARAEAFKALTGAELLVLVDEVSR